MLTAKQEKFIQNIVKGMSQREAYKDAYNADGMSDNAIDREASLLAKNPKVAQRHKELVDAIAKPTIMTAQERLEYLTAIVKDVEKENRSVVVEGSIMNYKECADISTKLKAIDLKLRMV